MNPELACTLPVYQVACGVTDIMMHTLDRYFNPTDNEVTDALAEALLRTVIANGRTAVADPHNYEAMSELMWAGSLSHNGLTGLGGQEDFAVHQLGHELSAMFDTAHGASLATVWDSWALAVMDAKPSRFARYAKNVWGISGSDEKELALAGIQATREYFSSLGMPVGFREIRILESRRIMSSANWPTAVPIRKHELSEPSVSLMKMESMRFTDRQTRNEPSSVLLKQVFELT